MRLSDFIKRVFQQFLLIFALVIIIMTLLRQLYMPDLSFDLKSIYTIMAFSLVAVLIGFITYTPRNISESNMRLRLVIHFISLEAILILLGSVTGILRTLSDCMILAIQIAVIYTILRLLSWRSDLKDSEEINEKLKLFQNNLEN